MAFGKTAENIEKFFIQGSKILVCGELQNNNYEKDGVKHYSMQIVVNEFYFVESKKAAEHSESQPAPEPTPAQSGDDFMMISDEEIEELPFN